MPPKRRRIALSCVACRRRRVKCDRSVPTCLRCQKSGVADQCKYVPYDGLDQDDQDGRGHAPTAPGIVAAGETHENTQIPSNRTATVPTSIYAPADPQAAHSDVLSQPCQIIHHSGPDGGSLGSTAYSAPSYGAATPLSVTTDNSSTQAASVTVQQSLVRGNGFKTQYHGPSHYASILLHFDELAHFTKDMVIRVREHRVQLSRRSAKFKELRRELDWKLTEQSHSHNALLKLLPEKSNVDAHVQRYLDSFETTHRVLHVPSFLHSYEAFWTAPNDSPTSFVVILLLAIACVYRISPQEPATFIGRYSMLREQATRWIAACEAWFEQQSQKHLTLATYQVRVLLFIAKRVNAVKVKRAWTGAGQLLRFAIDAGMHRKVSSDSVVFSVFESEMRKRLWATILELELITALDKGTAPAIRSGDWDCHSPSNIHDEEFGERSKVIPASRPLTQFTRTSWLCCANQSAALRVELASRINAVISAGITIEEAAQNDTQIRQAISVLPQWQNSHQYLDRPSPCLAHHLSRLQLIEYIILIYQPLATSKTPAVQQILSRAAFRDAATRILEIYEDLEGSGNFTMRFFRNDSFRAAQCLCYDFCIEPTFSNHITLNGERVLELLEHALLIQEERVLRLGEGLYAYWITCSAVSLAASKLSSDRPRDEHVSAAATRVLALYDRMEKLQEGGIEKPQSAVNDGILPDQAESVPLARGDISLSSDTFSTLDIGVDFGIFDSTDLGTSFWNFNNI